MSLSTEDRLLMMLGFAAVPDGMRPALKVSSSGYSSSSKSSRRRSSSSSSTLSMTEKSPKRSRVGEIESKEWTGMSLLERANAKKAGADAVFSSSKLHATPLYIASQLFMVEHVNGTLAIEDQDEEEEEHAQRLLAEVIKILKFCARTYNKHGLRRKAAVVHAYCAVVQTRYMRCRWAHYDVLRKNLVDCKTTNIEKFSDMMQGVSHIFDAYRSWKSAVDADPSEANRLSNWSVVSIVEAHSVVRGSLNI